MRVLTPVALVAFWLSGCAGAEHIGFALSTDQWFKPVQGSRTIRTPDPRRKAAAIAKSPTPHPAVAHVPVLEMPPWRLVAPKPSNGPQHGLSTSELFKTLSPSVYKVAMLRSQGSAVAISKKELVTNCHVVAHGPSISLTNGMTSHTAEVIAADLATDRCFLRVREGELQPVAAVRDFATLAVGEPVYTIGSPKGLQNTLGAGVLSGLRTGEDRSQYIQTSAPLSEGSSGGGLFDERGNLIGITTFTIRDAQSLNFAIAASQFWQ